MPLYPEYIIQEVIDKNDIVDVVSKQVRLKKSGANYMGLCPFHNEKTPSFSVSPTKGIFHCFGCGVGGSVINFVMKTENLTFTEAVKELAARANIVLPQINGYDSNKEKEIRDQKEILFNINEKAASFYFSYLSKDEGKVAVEYFKERKLDGKCAKLFYLGYSPNEKRKLFDYLVGEGFSESDILKAGLITKHENGDYYDKFRGRVMFPIFNVNDKIIGFGARRIDENVMPKYLNSPETLVYNKSKNLYALNLAKKSKKDFVILVEGYMDVISLMRYGFYNVVASLGTALTTEQAKLLKRYFNEVVISYDSDEAGQTAARRAIGILRDAEIKASVIKVDNAKDTDEFIKKYGSDRFNLILTKRKGDIAYLMDVLGEKYNLKNNDEKVLYVNELIPYLQKVTNSVELDVLVSEISAKTSISSQAIYLQIGKTKAKLTDDFSPKATVPHFGASTKDKLSRTQEMLLSLLINEPKLLVKAESILEDDLFDDELLKKLFTTLKEKKDHDIDASYLMTAFEEEDVAKITKIISIDTRCEDTLKAVKDYVLSIKEEKRRIEIDKLVKQGDINALNEIFKNNQKGEIRL
ncbi:MAG: DNA primase [Ruminococcaceae bacterium]|nr:DNA primase [Oscillospiraceae bacterium]